LDARVKKAVHEKIDEAVSNTEEVSQIAKSLAGIPVGSRDDFMFGIAVGRVYNSFHYQTRRALKRNATEEEFAEFLAILAKRAGEIRKSLKQQ
jgi:alkylhydroperoxidase/carboxymuconolactone decarboxylase family protein YurZ